MESDGLRVGYGGQRSIRRIYAEYLWIQTRRQSSVDQSIVLRVDIKFRG